MFVCVLMHPCMGSCQSMHLRVAGVAAVPLYPGGLQHWPSGQLVRPLCWFCANDRPSSRGVCTCPHQVLSRLLLPNTSRPFGQMSSHSCLSECGNSELSWLDLTLWWTRNRHACVKGTALLPIHGASGDTGRAAAQLT